MKTKSLRAFLTAVMGVLCVSCIEAKSPGGSPLTSPTSSAVSSSGIVKGFTLTEIGIHRYDAMRDTGSKSEAQYIVDRLYDLGIRHIVLSPRAIMRDPRQSFVEPMTPPQEMVYEREAYLRLIDYVHGRGMTVGMRPIFFVVDANFNTPVYEPLVGGGFKTWWHGNIQPNDPLAWYNSFRTYLEAYMDIASQGRVEEFTIGAELQSMTIGIGAEWAQYPQGFPRYLRDLLSAARARLGSATAITYDMNYADDEVITVNGVEYGGEILEWRKALVDDVANGVPPTSRFEDLAAVYRGLDFVGVDMYRSLASATEVLPVAYPELVAKLKVATDEFAAQLNSTVTAMNQTTGVTKGYRIKEVGFRSVERGFVDPFTYAGTGTLNAVHQAAAYEAVFQSFLVPVNPLMGGITFWDASVDTTRHGASDIGFSPIGKPITEQVMIRYLGQP